MRTRRLTVIGRCVAVVLLASPVVAQSSAGAQEGIALTQAAAGAGGAKSAPDGSLPNASTPEPGAPELPARGQATPDEPRKAGAPVAPKAQAVSLDMKSLEQRLRETEAIGVFTKLALKNQVDDLVARFRNFYDGRSRATLRELREAYELLVLKVLVLLQDGDPPLAREIAASREALWGILADRHKFGAL